MFEAAASLIGVLCYDQVQGVNFGDLNRNAMDLMNCKPGVGCSAVAHYDDLFVCDWGHMRLGFAHCQLGHDFSNRDDLAGFSESLMVIVGTRPDHIYDGPDIAERKQICSSLMDRIERVHPADDALLIDLPVAFTTHVYDQILENLWPTLASQKPNDDVIDFFLTQMAS